MPPVTSRFRSSRGRLSVCTSHLVMLTMCMMCGSLMAWGDADAAPQQPAPAPSWLDRPMSPWNAPGQSVPKAPRPEQPRADTMKRCDLKLLGSTAGERALADAGWIPYHNFDQQLVRDDVEIVGGMTGADGMCRPTGYNLFVFVSDLFAGTLSPVSMTSRLDSSSGAVRITGGDVITADFARYSSSDPLCCPSSHVTVRYRIDRSGPSATVVAAEARTRP